MNKFERMNSNKIFNFSDEIISFLKGIEYKLDSEDDIVSVLQKVYFSKDGLYYTYINIGIDRVSYYKEYNCGGCVDRGGFEIPEVAKYDLDKFIDFMGEVFENIDFE